MAGRTKGRGNGRRKKELNIGVKMGNFSFKKFLKWSSVRSQLSK